MPSDPKEPSRGASGDGAMMTAEGTERRDSLRATTTVRILVGGKAPIQRKGIVSLKNVFLEGGGALDASLEGASGLVEADAGDGVLSLPITVARPQGRPEAGWVLFFGELDFEQERRLARFLDENKGP